MIDLHLDQVIESIVAGRQDYDLKPFFHAQLQHPAAISYRQDVFRELENPAVQNAIRSFSRRMMDMRTCLNQAEKLYVHYQREKWFLDAVETYGNAVCALVEELSSLELISVGFQTVQSYLLQYAHSELFRHILEEAKALQADLAAIDYCILIQENAVEVRAFEQEPDYSEAVEKTFSKFRQADVKDYRVRFSEWPDMNHVEEKILEGVARLFPGPFERLDRFCQEHADFRDDRILALDREIQFYLAYGDYMARFRQNGLSFCYPQISTASKEEESLDGFDLSLAEVLMAKGKRIVCNDFFLKDPERIFVVSGPNQGGKTTFARTFGQLHYLASLGCPVPGRKARLFLQDRIFTHFEKEETIANLHGKLQDEIERVHEIVQQATSSSIVLLNEMFSSTTLQDAVLLSRLVLNQLLDRDVLGVCVTFIHELSSMSPKTVSVVSCVEPENPDLRTYRLVRKPADGLAYALSIAEKYRLSYRLLKGRLPS
ncbi:MutS-related protein [Desulfatirhabdium butyrativorans]|uniref:MutS-related protein n=1 Tax=Desulfatirhabdium butyrativorans TaxID=340467 RepID=UPI00041E506D|nr:hypothetical protein [Desulfatirhabdium butyrativorans]